jgi:hypothetical protein
VVCAVAVAGWCGETRGQPAASDVTDLAAVEKRAGDRGLSLREREQAADRAVELRRKLIGSAAEDEPRLTGWLIDQSGALLARLARDGSDSAVLFGIALPAQRTAVGVAAAEALKGLERAGARVEEGSRRLAASGVSPEDPVAVRLEQDRSVRVPFFHRTGPGAAGGVRERGGQDAARRSGLCRDFETDAGDGGARGGAPG